MHTVMRSARLLPMLGPLDGRAEGLLRVGLCTDNGARAALVARARSGSSGRLCPLLAGRSGCSRGSERAHLFARSRQLGLQPRLLSRQPLRRGHTHITRLLMAGHCAHTQCASRRLVGQHLVHVVLQRDMLMQPSSKSQTSSSHLRLAHMQQHRVKKGIRYGNSNRSGQCRKPGATWSFAAGAHAASLDSAGLSPVLGAGPGSSPRQSQRSNGSSSASAPPAALGPRATLPVAPGAPAGVPLRAHKLRPVRDTCVCGGQGHICDCRDNVQRCTLDRHRRSAQTVEYPWEQASTALVHPLRPLPRERCAHTLSLSSETSAFRS